jgi:hypothetical protein
MVDSHARFKYQIWSGLTAAVLQPRMIEGC